jgi:GT2 family glycosyltransferase
MAKVSIHLVTWNGEKYIEECLESILQQTLKDYFLLIIDNGSVDQTAKIIEEKYFSLFQDKIRFVQNKNNLGFARAHNQAILWTDSDYVLVLNQDVILEADFLEKTCDFLDNHPVVGSVSGKIFRWEFQNTDVLKNSLKSNIIDSLGLKIFKNQRVIEIASGEEDKGQYANNLEIFGVSATCAVYRRKALADVRYKDEFFDNDFFSYKEDFDLAYRLRWRAWSSYYLAAAKAYHDRTAKSQEKISNREIVVQRKYKAKYVNYHSYKNHLFVLLKNLSAANFFYYFFRISFYEFKKILYLLLFEWSTLKSLNEFMVKKKIIREKRRFIMKHRLIKDEEMRHWFN